MVTPLGDSFTLYGALAYVVYFLTACSSNTRQGDISGTVFKATSPPSGQKHHFCMWLRSFQSHRDCVIVNLSRGTLHIGSRAGRSGDRIPVWATFSAPVKTGPGAHPASCTMGDGDKAAGAWRRPPAPLSRAGIKERVELYVLSSSACSGVNVLLFTPPSTLRRWGTFNVTSTASECQEGER